MKSFITIVAPVLCCCTPLLAEEASREHGETPQGDKWTRVLKDRSERGILHDAFQYVRGDSGKWNDDPKLQHAPPRSAKISLDDWFDHVERTRRPPPTPADDNWLLLKTKQLDDNDRVWVERIERSGNRFTVIVNQAIWQGRYQKTFTYYGVFGVNLGRLAPGKYEAKCIVKPLGVQTVRGQRSAARQSKKRQLVERRTTR